MSFIIIVRLANSLHFASWRAIPQSGVKSAPIHDDGALKRGCRAVAQGVSLFCTIATPTSTLYSLSLCFNAQ
jgi:hypothetical protein